MSVCYTCGVEGKKHLIYCMHCKDYAVHSYCVDDPNIIKNWLCEECDVKLKKPTQPSKRTSSRLTSLIQKALLRKARKEGKIIKDVQDTKRQSSANSKENAIENNCALPQENKDGKNQANLVKLTNDKDNSSSPCSIDSKSPASTLSTENTLPYVYKDLKLDNGDVNDYNLEEEDLRLDGDVNAYNLEDEDCDENYHENSKELLNGEKDSVESFSWSYEEEQKLIQHKESDSTPTKAYYYNEKSIKVVKRKYEDYFHERAHENDYEKLDNRKSPIIKREESNGEISDSQGTKVGRRRLILENDCEDELDCLTPKQSNLEELACLNPKQSNFGNQGSHSFVNSPQRPSRTSNFGATPLLGSHDTMPNDYVSIQSTIEVSWSGRCGVVSNLQLITLGVVAHLSSKTSAKVYGATSVLPEDITFKLVPKQEVWPKDLETSPPTNADIALYFFPSKERDEEAYNIVLKKMIDFHYALTFNINNNLDLVLFSSQELPQEYCRFQRQYYMWGVFKPTPNSLAASLFTF